MREREEKAAKEAEAAGDAGAGKIKRKPLVKQAVTELLRSFGSFSELEVRTQNWPADNNLKFRPNLRSSCNANDNSCLKYRI